MTCAYYIDAFFMYADEKYCDMFKDSYNLAYSDNNLTVPI